MGLISVNGQNPFDGQADPYLSLESSVSYNDGGQGEIINNYILQGVITGCSKSELLNLQNNLAGSFDWKEDPSIPQNININGVVASNEKNQLIPTSLSFENSNYIGAISYTLNLEQYTGTREEDRSENIIDKVHSETTRIDEKECVTIDTSISCRPNQNLTGCGSIEAANKWISGQLGKTKLGSISRTKNLPLNNESLTIEPITSSISYSSSHGQDCNDLSEGGAPHSGFMLSYCSEDQTEDNKCPNALTTSSYEGEVYKSGANELELIEYLKDNLLDSFPNEENFSASYNNQQDSVSFSFQVPKTGGELAYIPRNLLVDDYTVTKSVDHFEGQTSYSVNGKIFILNKDKNNQYNVLGISKGEIISRAASHIDGAAQVSSYSISKNEEAEEISYNARYDSEPNNSTTGISSSSISYTPALYSYDVQNTLCGFVISRSNCPSRGNINVQATASSGSGYNYLEVVKAETSRMLSFTAGAGVKIENEDLEYSEDKSSVTHSLDGSWGGEGSNKQPTSFTML